MAVQKEVADFKNLGKKKANDTFKISISSVCKLLACKLITRIIFQKI